MLTSLSLWIVSGHQGSSVVGGEKAPAAAAEKAVPPADKTATDEKAALPAEKTDPQKPPATAGPVEKK
jgi:hypothetical protein